MARIQMLNHHERHSAVGRHCLEKLFQRIDSPGRCADADYPNVCALNIHGCLTFFLRQEVDKW